MISFRKIALASLSAALLAGAAAPASAEPFHGHGGFGGGFHDGGHGGWGGRGWDGGHRHWGGGWGPGGYLAVGGLGLATGALIANSYRGRLTPTDPAVARPSRRITTPMGVW